MKRVALIVALTALTGCSWRYNLVPGSCAEYGTRTNCQAVWGGGTQCYTVPNVQCRYQWQQVSGFKPDAAEKARMAKSYREIFGRDIDADSKEAS